MPLYKTITINEHTRLLIWKIEETFEDLYRAAGLTFTDEKRVRAMKSGIHRRGFLSVRHLLAIAGYEAADLYYDDFGKPHLKNGSHISITHSFNFSAIILSAIEVGVDIEKQHDTIEKIAPKFIGYEWNYLAPPCLQEKLTVIWCIKESLYKSMAMRGVSFKQHCQVLPFELGSGKTKAWIHFKSEAQKYDASFFSFENYSCAYTLKEPLNYANCF